MKISHILGGLVILGLIGITSYILITRDPSPINTKPLSADSFDQNASEINKPVDYSNLSDGSEN